MNYSLLVHEFLEKNIYFHNMFFIIEKIFNFQYISSFSIGMCCLWCSEICWWIGKFGYQSTVICKHAPLLCSTKDMKNNIVDHHCPFYCHSGWVPSVILWLFVLHMCGFHLPFLINHWYWLCCALSGIRWTYKLWTVSCPSINVGQSKCTFIHKHYSIKVNYNFFTG